MQDPYFLCLAWLNSRALINYGPLPLITCWLTWPLASGRQSDNPFGDRRRALESMR